MRSDFKLRMLLRKRNVESSISTSSASRFSTQVQEHSSRSVAFRAQEQQWIKPDTTISGFVAALKTCIASKDLEKGRKIHAAAAENGKASSVYVASTLVNMYAKCGSMVEARRVFEGMQQRDVVSWTALILGYVENGDGEKALELFSRMQPEGCAPDARAFVAALRACTVLAVKEEGRLVDGKVLKPVALEKGMVVHSQAAKSNCESDKYIGTALIDMYAKCGSLVDAQRVFNQMPSHDVVSWTKLILRYAESGEGELALDLFFRMEAEGFSPDSRAFVAAVKACTSLAAKEEAKEVDGKHVKLESLEKGMAIHSRAVSSGCDSNIFVASTLVDMYSKIGSMMDARKVFDKMECRNVVSWTSLMLGYVEIGDGESALELFEQMQCAPDPRTFVVALKACATVATKEEGKQVQVNSNTNVVLKVKSLQEGMSIHSQAAKCGCEQEVFVSNSLVDMYAKCGSLADARRVFNRMPCPDVISWNALMLGYAENGEAEPALELFSSMQLRGSIPNSLSYVAALKACGSIVALEIGKLVHVQICRSGLENDEVLANCLVDVYGKCGSMVDSQLIFDAMRSNDLVTWTSLIAGYSRHGDTDLMFHLLKRMQVEGFKANSVTCLSILTACSHSGLLEKGKAYFEAVKSFKYGFSPGIEHYHCMVDLLGRANHFEAAVALVKSMPFPANIITWKTLLSASKKWKNVEVGKLAFDNLVKMDEKQDPAYLLMASIYGSAGMWEKQAEVESLRVTAGAHFKAGKSWWSDGSGRIHTFVVGDQNHPQIEEIWEKLRVLQAQMKELGYIADVGGVVHRNMSHDEKLDSLCGHSERLAIGCALINTAPGSAIRITKNLRACDDCHRATALISQIEKRRIVCRDANRFHIFEGGRCSCGDYW